MRANSLIRGTVVAAAILAGMLVAGGKAVASSASVELASRAGASELRLKVSSACDGSTAVISLYNAGQAWPAVGTLGIYHVTRAGVEVITTRRMRLVEGQKASFRIPQKKPGYVGFYVSPSWYRRHPAWDALASCH